jgi:predicted  nucleic acid-binding Zn-ribbon protein
MKSNKLLETLKDYLGVERRAQIAKYASIKQVLKKLKKKENILKDKLKKERDEKAYNRLKKEMDVLSAQRKKGVKILKELKQAKNKS